MPMGTISIGMEFDTHINSVTANLELSEYGTQQITWTKDGQSPEIGMFTDFNQGYLEAGNYVFTVNLEESYVLDTVTYVDGGSASTIEVVDYTDRTFTLKFYNPNSSSERITDISGTVTLTSKTGGVL